MQGGLPTFCYVHRQRLPPCTRSPDPLLASARTLCAQARAEEFLNQVKQQPNCSQICMERFLPANNAEVKFWCLQTLLKVRKNGRVCGQCGRALGFCMACA